MADNFSIYDYGDFFAPNFANNANLFRLEQQIAVPSPILVPNSTSFPPVNYLGDPYESVDGTSTNIYYSYGAGDTNNSSTSTSESPSCYNQRRRPSLMQRSLSGHLLQNQEFHHPAAAFSLLNKCRPEISSMETGPMMRKVVSTGDMQDRLIIEESMRPVARYSAEERKERIERYRSKRNQRNFNKKIQYVCRKTLADNRPRIKGRFMRNEETNNEEIISSTNQSRSYREEQEDEQDHSDIWTSFLDELLTIN